MSASCQLLVIGAGPAGMAAAQAAAGHGVDVVVVDEQPHPGGQIYRNVDASPLADVGQLGKDYLYGQQLVRTFRRAPVDYRADAAVWYLDRSGEVGIVEQGLHRRLQAQRVIIACGAQERPMPFPGWDKPGVMTAGAGQILMKSAAMVPRQEVVLAGSGPLLLLLAWQYLRAGVKIRALVETSHKRARRAAWRHLPRALAASDYLFKGARLVAAIRRARVPWFRQASDLRAEGGARIDALSFSCGGRQQRIATGLLLLHQGVIPSLHMAAAAGCDSHWSESQQCWQTATDDWGETSQAGIFVAGDAAAIGGAPAASLSGELAGLQVAHQLGLLPREQRVQQARALRNARARHLAIRPFLDSWYRLDESSLGACDETLACRCEEVSVAQLRALAAAGCAGPNQAKAFTRCGMGPCQGRFCGATMEQIFSSETATGRQQVGRFNARPPLKPVTLGQLAGSDSETNEGIPR